MRKPEIPAAKAMPMRWNYGFVLAQGLLFAAIGLWPPGWGPQLASNLWLGMIVTVIGATITVWSVPKLGRALTPLPLSNARGLATTGPYRWARHPLYTGLLFICAGVAIGRGMLAIWVAWILLAVLLFAKTLVEEKSLLATYPEYADYRSSTGRFGPRC